MSLKPAHIELNISEIQHILAIALDDDKEKALDFIKQVLLRIPFWEGTVSKIYDCVWNLSRPQHHRFSESAVPSFFENLYSGTIL